MTMMCFDLVSTLTSAKGYLCRNWSNKHKIVKLWYSFILITMTLNQYPWFSNMITLWWPTYMTKINSLGQIVQKVELRQIDRQFWKTSPCRTFAMRKSTPLVFSRPLHGLWFWNRMDRPVKCHREGRKDLRSAVRSSEGISWSLHTSDL